MKEVSIFYAKEVYCYCPHCKKRQNGWIPCPGSGEVEVCEDCGEMFKVHDHYDIEAE